MGDRATIRIKQHGSATAIHFYTHWRGGSVNGVVADALERADQEGRITDDSYCTRIIFDTLTELEGGSTGYGIIIGDSQRPGDVEHDSPSIEWDSFGAEPLVRMYYTSGYFSPAVVPWKQWVADQKLSDFPSHDLTAV